jgi:hypothetical protein
MIYNACAHPVLIKLPSQYLVDVVLFKGLLQNLEIAHVLVLLDGIEPDLVQGHVA